MKKRLLSLLLAIVMTCTLLPTAVWAEEITLPDAAEEVGQVAQTIQQDVQDVKDEPEAQKPAGTDEPETPPAPTAEDAPEEEPVPDTPALPEPEVQSVSDTMTGSMLTTESTIASGTCGASTTWALSDDGTLTISGTGDVNGSGHSAPWYNVESKVKKVVIGSGISSIVPLTGSIQSGIIYYGMFDGCDNLTDIYVAAGNSVYESINGVLFSKPTAENEYTKRLLLYPRGRSASYSVPANTDIVDQRSFSGSKVISVTIPDSVKSIGCEAFLGCTDLESVSIGAGVTDIAYSVDCSGCFDGCSKLQTITVSPKNSAYEAEDGVLYNKGKTKLLQCAPGLRGTLVIPDSVREINSGAFSYCQVTAVILPQNLTLIKNNTFSGCNMLSITIPKSVTAIDAGAFWQCERLRNGYCDIYYGGSAAEWNAIIVGEYNNDLISAVNKGKIHYNTEMPAGVCEDGLLWSVSRAGVLTISGKGAMDEELYGAVKGPWVYYTNIINEINITEGVSSIGICAFEHCSAVKTVRIPKSVKSIGAYAFRHSPTPITNVYYAGTATEWAKIAIAEGNEKLTNATIHYAGLGIPTITLTTASNGNPVIKWTKVTGAAQYEVYRSDTGKANTFKIVRRTSGLTYTDTSAATGKTYYYVVRAINGSTAGKFCAPQSVAVSGALGVPAMTLTTASKGNPVIKWTKVDGAAQYEVYRSLTGKANSYSIVRRTAGLTFTDTAAATGKTYYYVVRAINGSTAGKFCAAKSVAVALGVPTMTVKLGSDGKPVVSWAKVTGAAQYEVYRSLTGKANSYSIIRRTAGLTFTDTAAATGKTYYYVVRAINGGAAGKFCAAKFVTAQMALGVPTMTLGIDLSDGLTTVWWSKVANAVQYEIYRSDSGKSGTFKIVRRTAGTFWKDNTAQVGKTYYYTVRAMRGSGTSVVYGGFCPVQERVCSQPPTLESPYFYYMALNSSGKPVLKWEGVPDADYYVIFRTDNGGFSISDIGYVEAGSELTYTDTTAVAGVRYGYSVSCETYEGAYSAPSDQYYITAR